MLGSIFSALLEIPFVYSFVQFIAAPGQKKLLGTHFNGIFEYSKGLVIDIGCGPKLTTPPPEGTLVGVDININYIRKFMRGESLTLLAKAHSEKTRIMGMVSSVDELSVHGDLFDECRCAGVLHHLPPENARTAIGEMHRSVRRGGRIIIFDNVMPLSGFTRPLAWLIRKMDRGEWVRSEEQLVQLVQSAGEEIWTSTRFTYSYYGLEGMIFVAVKR